MNLQIIDQIDARYAERFHVARDITRELSDQLAHANRRIHNLMQEVARCDADITMWKDKHQQEKKAHATAVEALEWCAERLSDDQIAEALERWPWLGEE